MKQTALHCISDAIEIDGTSPASDRRLELLVPAAADYMVALSKLLYQYSRDEFAREGDYKHEPIWQGGEDDGGKMLWVGNWGYSLERWAFWKERFEGIGRRLEGVNPVVSEQCARAVLCMKEAEASAKESSVTG